MAPAALEALSTLRTRMSTSPTRAISRASTVYGTLSAGPVSAPDTLPAPGCSRPAEVEVRVRAGMSPPSPGLLVAPARAAPGTPGVCMTARSFAAPAGWHQPQRLDHLFFQGIALLRIVARSRCGRPMVLCPGQPRDKAAAAQHVVTGIGSNAIDPGRTAGTVGQAGERTIHLHKGVLQEIVGLVTVTHQAVDIVVEGRLVLGIQVLEDGALRCGCQRYGLHPVRHQCVASRRTVHRTV